MCYFQNLRWLLNTFKTIMHDSMHIDVPESMIGFSPLWLTEKQEYVLFF